MNAPTNTATAISTEIQMGDSTHSHDQAMTSVSLSAMNRSVRREGNDSFMHTHS